MAGEPGLLEERSLAPLGELDDAAADVVKSRGGDP